jgi:5-methylcytosine-specific restriction protein A
MRNCVQCGKSFEARCDWHSFCSDACRRSARGSDYRRNRELALRRDAYNCTECGATDHLECHHQRPLYLGGDHRLSNLQTLCRPCHKAKHRNWRKYGYSESEVHHHAA